MKKFISIFTFLLIIIFSNFLLTRIYAENDQKDPTWGYTVGVPTGGHRYCHIRDIKKLTGQHQFYCVDHQATFSEKCNYDVNGICTVCGQAKEVVEPSTTCQHPKEWRVWEPSGKYKGFFVDKNQHYLLCKCNARVTSPNYPETGLNHSWLNYGSGSNTYKQCKYCGYIDGDSTLNQDDTEPVQITYDYSYCDKNGHDYVYNNGRLFYDRSSHYVLCRNCEARLKSPYYPDMEFGHTYNIYKKCVNCDYYYGGSICPGPNYVDTPELSGDINEPELSGDINPPESSLVPDPLRYSEDPTVGGGESKKPNMERPMEGYDNGTTHSGDRKAKDYSTYGKVGVPVRAAKDGKIIKQVMVFKDSISSNGGWLNTFNGYEGFDGEYVNGQAYWDNYWNKDQDHRNASLGNYIVIYHEEDQTYTLYAHLEDVAKYSVGEVVAQGATIGYSGHTGCASGPHLHFEGIKSGAPGQNDRTAGQMGDFWNGLNDGSGNYWIDLDNAFN